MTYGTFAIVDFVSVDKNTPVRHTSGKAIFGAQSINFRITVEKSKVAK